MAVWFDEAGNLDTSRFSSWNDVFGFIDDEESGWSWLFDHSLTGGAATFAQRLKAAFNADKRHVRDLQSYGNPYPAGVEHLRQSYASSPPKLIRSDSPLTEAGGDIYEAATPDAAAFFLGFKSRLVTLSDAVTNDDLIGAFWEVAPGLKDTAHLASLLKRERDSARKTVKDLSEKALAADAARTADWDERMTVARESYVRWARGRSRRWAERTNQWIARHIESEQRIQAVEKTYREHMGLKAPVEYWQNKSLAHGKSESMLRWLVIGFFAVAILAIVIAFWNVGWTLINLSLDRDAKPLPPGVYVVASAGLGSAAAVLFWGGRLLTKLYLSQHHLRQDAEERATMTETYLALIENQAAGTEDRQVILNALFRATPDGIVKEEGGLDPSIAAALGKYLAK